MNGILASMFKVIFLINPLRRFYYGLYKKIFLPLNLFHGVTKTMLYKGKFTLKLDIGDWIGQNLYFLDEYEEKETKFLKSTLKEGDVFIDVGANIGIFSLVASDAVGLTGKVYSFEPFSLNFEKLKDHVRLNNIQNATIEKIGLSDRSAEITLHIDTKDRNHGMATAYPVNYNHTETVQTMSLDAYVLNMSIRNVSVIKMDIEGGEYPALLGMTNTLKQFHPKLIIEVNPEILKFTPYTVSEIESFLGNFSYKKRSLNEAGELISTQLETDASCNYIFI